MVSMWVKVDDLTDDATLLSKGLFDTSEPVLLLHQVKSWMGVSMTCASLR